MKPQLLIETWGLPFSDTLSESESNLVQTLVEAKKDSKGALYIEGIFLQAEVVNRNKRLYPRSVLERAVDEYIREQVNTKQALGELNHPARPMPDPLNAAIIIEKMWWEGNNVMGRARIIEGDNGVGDKTAALIRAGWVPGVSSRGLGALKEKAGYNEVQDGFKLTVGVDVVWGPSAPNAYVKSIQESTVIAESTPNVVNEDDNRFGSLLSCLEKLV
ncbi:MAG: prohead core scaffolding protein and protease [Bacilli bacterium]